MSGEENDNSFLSFARASVVGRVVRFFSLRAMGAAASGCVVVCFSGLQRLGPEGGFVICGDGGTVRTLFGRCEVNGSNVLELGITWLSCQATTCR